MDSLEGKIDWDFSGPWYHGSPLPLQALRQGSTITQDRELARVFSHKPGLVSLDDDGAILHDGVLPGYLYEIAETVLPQDLTAHPFSSMDFGKEWLTNRELPLHLIARIQPRADEQITEEHLRQLKYGKDFAEPGPD